MMQQRTVELSELDHVLTKLGAKLRAHEVHALFLGALTSTGFGVGPHRLLDVIFGEDMLLGESLEEVNAVIEVLFGYWNTLASERQAGSVRFAPQVAPRSIERDSLRDLAERRRSELQWYVRGIDAGGDDPLEWGSPGRALLEKLAEAGVFLEAFVAALSRADATDTTELEKTRDSLLQTSAICEQLIADLMAVTDRVRREALETAGVMHGHQTDDGVRIGDEVHKVPRNQRCPCGSGKKWKQCCGLAGTTH